jgi:glycosyl hydrolase family 63
MSGQGVLHCAAASLCSPTRHSFCCVSYCYCYEYCYYHYYCCYCYCCYDCLCPGAAALASRVAFTLLLFGLLLFGLLLLLFGLLLFGLLLVILQLSARTVDRACHIPSAPLRLRSFIWESYDVKQGGRGKGTHPFTGWSALVVLIMAEVY